MFKLFKRKKMKEKNTAEKIMDEICPPEETALLTGDSVAKIQEPEVISEKLSMEDEIQVIIDSLEGEKNKSPHYGNAINYLKIAKAQYKLSQVDHINDSKR